MSTEQRVGPDKPDNDMVICPNCTSQFPAIPVNVQARLSDVDAMREHIAKAWMLIANVNGGDWSKQSDEWREAAEKWERARNPYEGLAKKTEVRT